MGMSLIGAMNVRKGLLEYLRTIDRAWTFL